MFDFGANYRRQRNEAWRNMEAAMRELPMADKVRRPKLGDMVLVNRAGDACTGMVCHVDPDALHINAAVFDKYGVYVGGVSGLVYTADAALTDSWAYMRERA